MSIGESLDLQSGEEIHKEEDKSTSASPRTLSHLLTLPSQLDSTQLVRRPAIEQLLRNAFTFALFPTFFLSHTELLSCLFLFSQRHHLEQFTSSQVARIALPDGGRRLKSGSSRIRLFLEFLPFASFSLDLSRSSIFLKLRLPRSVYCTVT